MSVKNSILQGHHVIPFTFQFAIGFLDGVLQACTFFSQSSHVRNDVCGEAVQFVQLLLKIKIAPEQGFQDSRCINAVLTLFFAKNNTG
ncbi:hypothetical protein A3463_08655 [Enterobacter chengduensis]|nr:hypothetical protein A3463_08655 [Enterobacter chengduensis]